MKLNDLLFYRNLSKSVLFDGRGSSGGSETHGSFESIIDPPLETGQGTNHENSGSETSPQSSHSDFSVNFLYIFTERGFRFNVIQFRHPKLSKLHGIGGVGYDGAEDTGQITRGESDSKLGGFAVFALGFSENMLVEFLNNIFKSNKLNHSVGNLSAPERHETLEKSVVT